jgi:ABC-type multidrug transport system fused ATPase/permease subunit
MYIEIEKLWDFFDETPNIKWYDTWKDFIHDKWRIEIRKLSYSYVKWKKVFDDFSLDIEWEKVLAMVWNSWWGKSTLAKLISWYIRADKWEIIIDNQKLNEVSLKTYYKDIWYLTQEPSVFDGTVMDNLTYAIDRKLQEWEINEVIKNSKCEFIYELPKWIDTEIWERGVKLSGWQKQRLAIAKIFLKDPKIIILDEPTSALDSFSEEQISLAMRNLFKGRTVIIIAHRLQTVKHADRIIVLDNWKIIEDWTHSELIKSKWQYAKMLKLQSWF